jgi:shikimate dehydrogenase
MSHGRSRDFADLRSSQGPERPQILVTDTKIKVGLIGHGIQASRSPAMHMEEARAIGLDLSYVLLDSDQPDTRGNLEETLSWAEGEGFSGVNVTFPFKQAVIPLLDDLSEDARRLGAVNTVVFQGGRRVGHNTDWSGYAESFRRGLPDVRLERAVQIGAGGAGAAVAYALLQRGVGHLSIFDLEKLRASQLVDSLNAIFGEGRATPGLNLEQAVMIADGITNATPIGMAKYPGTPLPVDLLRPDQWVSEVIYFPLETALVEAARAKGCRVLDGGGMAVFQAAEAFQLFTQVAPDTERMRARFLADVSKPDLAASALA